MSESYLSNLTPCDATQCCRFLTTCFSFTGIAQDRRRSPAPQPCWSRSSSGLCWEASLAPPSPFQQTQYFMLTRLAFSFGERTHKKDGSFRMPTSLEWRNQSTAVGRRAFLHGALGVRDRNCFRKQDLESTASLERMILSVFFCEIERSLGFEWSDLFCINQPGDRLGIRSSSFSVTHTATDHTVKLNSCQGF